MLLFLLLLFYWKIKTWGYYTVKTFVIDIRLTNCPMKEIIIVEGSKGVLNAKYSYSGMEVDVRVVVAFSE